VLKRTHYCDVPREDDIGRTVTVSGWVANWRDHGGLVFIDLRDRTGVVQVVFNPEENPELHGRANRLRSEFCVSVRGNVTKRPSGMENPELATGMVEISAQELVVHNASEPPPFDVDNPGGVALETRLAYRFIDLRRPEIYRIFQARHRIFQTFRRFFDDHGFLEVETPVLTKSTPEGARDFLVPSRLSPGEFYALPQSPQLFKQTLMVGGLDRYFQIVKCFRDEDVRAARQPEFTQLDIEMSFADENDIMEITEKAVSLVFEKVLDYDLPLPLPKLTYADAMERYGTDAPDLRYGLEIKNISDIASECGFRVFKNAVSEGGCVRGICVPGGADMSRGEIDGLVEYVKQYDLPGLAWFKLEDDGPVGGVAKFFTESEISAIAERFSAGAGALFLFAADKRRKTSTALSQLRTHVAEKTGIIPHGKFDLCWVVDAPAFERAEPGGHLTFPHHPFTAPYEEDIDLLEKKPTEARTKSYDLVLNGVELGGGSMRISDPELQMKVFRILGYSEQEAEERFGFLLRALRHGAPPHAGIALGLDRVTGKLLGIEDIRETIAFPKTQKGLCVLTGAPSRVEDEQLKELAIKVRSRGTGREDADK